jgi:mannose-1-phosphate guanylyltransferase
MNTGPAILSSTLIQDIPNEQPLIFLSSDHLIEKDHAFFKEIKKHKKYLRFVLMIGASKVTDLTLSRVFPNKVQLPKSINCFAW